MLSRRNALIAIGSVAMAGSLPLTCHQREVLKNNRIFFCIRETLAKNGFSLSLKDHTVWRQHIRRCYALGIPEILIRPDQQLELVFAQRVIEARIDFLAKFSTAKKVYSELYVTPEERKFITFRRV